MGTPSMKCVAEKNSNKYFSNFNTDVNHDSNVLAFFRSHLFGAGFVTSYKYNYTVQSCH